MNNLWLLNPITCNQPIINLEEEFIFNLSVLLLQFLRLRRWLIDSVGGGVFY